MGQGVTLPLCNEVAVKGRPVVCLPAACRGGGAGRAGEQAGSPRVEEVVVVHTGNPHGDAGLCAAYPLCCLDGTAGELPVKSPHPHAARLPSVEPSLSIELEEVQDSPRSTVDSVNLPLLQRSWQLRPHRARRFTDYYGVGKKLGEGSFGNVYLATGKPVDPTSGRPVPGQEVAREGDVAAEGKAATSSSAAAVAAKIFEIPAPAANKASPRSPRSQTDDARQRQSWEVECGVLAQLSHPNICRMYECFSDPERLYIVLELCLGGELYTRLVSQTLSHQGGSGGLDASLAAHFFRQMLQAVGYLHTKRIVHRDLKTENFLLLGEEGTAEYDVVKLCDFGTSAQLSNARPRSMENIGTLSYTAPEIYANRGAACAADAWSLGVVLYVLLTGSNPFRTQGKTAREETVRRIQTGQFEQRRASWISISRKGQDLVRRLLVLDENTRLTCREALRHQWLASTDRPSALDEARQDEAVAAQAPQLLGLVLKLPLIEDAQRLVLTACSLASADPKSHCPGVRWRELFLELDEDVDGRLTYKEFARGLKSLLGASAESLSEQQLQACAEALDFDSSGLIEWAEWIVLALLTSGGLWDPSGVLHTAHRMLDRGPSGVLHTAHRMLDRSVTDQREANGQALSPGHIISRAVDPKRSEALAGDGDGGPGSYLLLSDMSRVVESCEVMSHI